MTLLESTAGAIDKRAEYRTTSTPAICKILMIKPAVPKVLCQPHEHVSLSKTSLKKLKSNVQRLKLWLGEIVFLSFTLELWVAPRHSNDTSANITWQVHCNDRPRLAKCRQETERSSLVVTKCRGSPLWTLCGGWPEWAKRYKNYMKQHQRHMKQEGKTTGSVDSTNNWVNWQYWVQTCDQFHYQLTTCLSVESKDVDAKPLPPAPPGAVRSSSASNPQALQRTLASQ